MMFATVRSNVCADALVATLHSNVSTSAVTHRCMESTSCIGRASVTEGNTEIARSLNDVGVRWYGLDMTHRVSDRHGAYLRRIHRDHGAEIAILDAAHGCCTESQRNQPVIRVRCAAALQM